MNFPGTNLIALSSPSKERLSKELCSIFPSDLLVPSSNSLCIAAISLQEKSEIFFSGASGCTQDTLESSSP